MKVRSLPRFEGRPSSYGKAIVRRVQSVLTSPIVRDKQTGIGWVAYHDVSKGATAALGMTWRATDGSFRWAAIIDRVHEGWVTFGGALGLGGDVHKALNVALRATKAPRPYTEGQILAMMLPNAGRHTGHPDAFGLPDIARHAQIARRAVEEVDMPIAMREALRACLDRGAPQDTPRTHLRSDGERGDWNSLILSTQHPALVRTFMSQEPRVFLRDDPIGEIRGRYPKLTDTHRRRLRELGDAYGSRILAGDPSTAEGLIDLLTFIPDDWWPTAKEVDAFKSTASVIKELKPICGYDLAPLLSGAKGDWEAFAGRLYRAAGIDGPKSDNLDFYRLGVRAGDCRDPVNALMNGLILPLVASRADDESVERIEAAQDQTPPYPDEWYREPNRRAARAAAVSLLYGSKSAPGVLEASTRWHGMQADMTAKLRRGEGMKGWPPLFHGEFRHGDAGIVAIKDYDALRDEGGRGPGRDGVAGLDHCVLSRMPQCLSGEAHMLSIRQYAPDGSWRRISTCQVSLAKTEGQPLSLKVYEHRGVGNAFPKSPAHETLAKFLGAFRGGLLRVEPQALVRRKAPESGGIARQCGYDWRDPEALAQALTVWEPLLPKWARGHGPDGFMDLLEERGLVPEWQGKPRYSPRP